MCKKKIGKKKKTYQQKKKKNAMPTCIFLNKGFQWILFADHKVPKTQWRSQKCQRAKWTQLSYVFLFILKLTKGQTKAQITNSEGHSFQGKYTLSQATPY